MAPSLGPHLHSELESQPLSVVAMLEDLPCISACFKMSNYVLQYMAKSMWPPICGASTNFCPKLENTIVQNVYNFSSLHDKASFIKTQFSQRPELNPNEHLRDELEREHPRPTSVSDLTNTLITDLMTDHKSSGKKSGAYYVRIIQLSENMHKYRRNKHRAQK